MYVPCAMKEIFPNIGILERLQTSIYIKFFKSNTADRYNPFFKLLKKEKMVWADVERTHLSSALDNLLLK